MSGPYYEVDRPTQRCPLSLTVSHSYARLHVPQMYIFISIYHRIQIQDLFSQRFGGTSHGHGPPAPHWPTYCEGDPDLQIPMDAPMKYTP